MDMMISGFDAAALVTAAGSVLKMLHTDRKAKTLDEEVAVLKTQVEGFKKELQVGNQRFEKQDEKLDTVISKVSEIDKNVGIMLGYVKGQSGAAL